MKMLASLVSDDGNTPKMKGFIDGISNRCPLRKPSS